MKKKKELLIEITNKCPFNCIFCSSDSTIYKKKYIEKKKFIELIQDAKKLGLDIIQLSGGEPFLHPNIIEFIDYILNCDFLLEIYSCGCIYKDREYLPIPKNILMRYKNHPNLTIRYNFQTIDKENFAKLTKTTFGFENTITSIKSCIDLNINTEVHIIPNCLNIKYLEDTIEYLINELNIKHVKILRLILHGRALKNHEKLVFSKEDLAIILNNVKLNYPSSKVEIGSAFSNLSNSCFKCEAGKNKFMITSDLKLFPCTAFKNISNCFVKLNDKNSLRKVISNRLLDIELQHFKENLKCGYCLERKICNEICPIQKLVCNNIKQIDLTKDYIPEEFKKIKGTLENIIV